MDLVIYAGRISRCIEREYNRGSRKWKFELCNSREVSNRSEKIIWWWRYKGGRTEEGKARRKDNGIICTEV